MRRQRGHILRAPFLRSIELRPERVTDASTHPFDIRALTYPDFRLDFSRTVTILVGPNGSGKSTIIEAIAAVLNRRDLWLRFSKTDFSRWSDRRQNW